jgi:ABC-type sulfate/molybdate transport systems ATPase subunit
MSIADKIAVMRNGLIEQLGRPLDIYRYPESTYVANFVGSANFLKAVVTGHTAETLPGTILRGSYLGSQVIYSIKAGEEILTVTVPNPTEKEVCSPGVTVGLILPEYIHLIDADQAGEIYS